MRTLPAPYAHRIALPADLPAIVDIYNSTIPSRMVTADIEPVSVASRRAWFDEHRPERYPLWVVEEPGRVGPGRVEPGRVLAWLSYSPFHPRAAYAHTAEISIYVHELARGRGIGRYLLQQAIDAAPQLGFRTLLGLIFGHNGASLALFEAAGFARWADMPGVAELDGVARDLIIVGRRVG